MYKTEFSNSGRGRKQSLVVQPEKMYITESGLESLKAQLINLKTNKRAEIIDRIASAKDLWGISENSEYMAALEEQMMIENKISHLENLLKNAKLILGHKQQEVVGIGSVVKVVLKGKAIDFTIVGKFEADPSRGKISNESPLGKALLGSKTGSEVRIIAPTGSYNCRILSIR